MFIKQIQDQLLESCPPQTDVLSGRQVLIGPYQEKPALSLPAFLRLVGLLLLPLPLSSHLLQLLPVFPLDEALLMGHLWEVIWSSERQGGKPRGVDQGEQTQRETEETKSASSQDTTSIILLRHSVPRDWAGLVWRQSGDEDT